jgi:hypothetical protein
MLLKFFKIERRGCSAGRDKNVSNAFSEFNASLYNLTGSLGLLDKPGSLGDVVFIYYEVSLIRDSWVLLSKSLGLAAFMECLMLV